MGTSEESILNMNGRQLLRSCGVYWVLVLSFPFLFSTKKSAWGRIVFHHCIIGCLRFLIKGYFFSLLVLLIVLHVWFLFIYQRAG